MGFYWGGGDSKGCLQECGSFAFPENAEILVDNVCKQDNSDEPEPPVGRYFFDEIKERFCGLDFWLSIVDFG